MAMQAILFLALAATTASAAAAAGAGNLGLDTWLDGSPIPLSSGIDRGSNLIASSSVQQYSISAWLEVIKRLAGEEWLPDEGACEIWRRVRAAAVAPLLNALIGVSTVMSVMLVAEALFMSSVSLFAKLLRRTPEKRYRWEAIDGGGDEEDAGGGSSAYPMVLVQIPMYNEKEVYRLSIAAACGLTWPTDRIIVQVLDDSTDPAIKDLVELECQAWARKGASIKYEVRENRKGHKAGALKKGLEHSYVHQCDFVAIFDADFQPESDFLIRTIPFLLYNSEVALVQARWAFVNYDKCLLTRMQRMYLDYHFKVEQESGSSSFGFFGFNGSAGVWRLSAINNAGGWKDRTTVEDMDLAVRAALKGWRFIYVDDIRVKSELPSTYKAYRYQQHRWVSGAANLFRITAWGIVTAKEVSIWMKIHVLYSFFFVRRVISPIVTFVLYCVVIPVSVMVPEVTIPILVASYIPTTVTILTAIRSPRALHILPFWILLENVMAMHRMRASVMGLLDTAGVHEWVVTKKLGDATLKKKPQSVPKLSTARFDRASFAHFGFAAFLIFCGTYNAMFGNNFLHVYIYIQAFAHVVAGFGNFSTCISSS